MKISNILLIIEVILLLIVITIGRINKKLFSLLKKNKRKSRELYINLVAGLFSGLFITMTVNSWRKYIVKQQDYILLFLFLLILWIFYITGKFFINPKNIFEYKINFLIGLLTSLYVALSTLFLNYALHFALAVLILFAILNFIFARYLKRKINN